MATEKELPKNVYAVPYKVKGAKRTITKTKYQYKRMIQGLKISKLFDTPEEAEEWGGNLPTDKAAIEIYLEEQKPSIVAKKEKRESKEADKLLTDNDKQKLKYLLNLHFQRYVAMYSGGYTEFKIKALGIKLDEKQIYNIENMRSRYKQIINTQFL